MVTVVHTHSDRRMAAAALLGKRIFELPRRIELVSAFAIIPGINENASAQQGAAAWEERDPDSPTQHLLCANPVGGLSPSIALSLGDLVNSDSVLRQKESAPTQADQTGWVAAIIRAKLIDSVAFFAPEEVLLPILGLLIKDLVLQGLWVPVVPVPVNTTQNVRTAAGVMPEAGLCDTVLSHYISLTDTEEAASTRLVDRYLARIRAHHPEYEF